MNPQDGFDDGGISRFSVLAPTSVAEGGWVKRVEPSTRVDAWFPDILAVALADSPPVPPLDLLPLGLEARVGYQDLAAVAMCERASRLEDAVRRVGRARGGDDPVRGLRVRELFRVEMRLPQG
jgi:hypothetical protein